MKTYKEYSLPELEAEYTALLAEYEKIKAKGLSLNMARGKPSPTQLNMSADIMDFPGFKLFESEDGTDTRNYGVLAGLPEARELFAGMLGLKADNIIVCGQSSLNLMYDCIMKALVLGVYGGSKPWGRQETLKFLCPVPGYDRHFRITQDLGFELICIPMSENGPDMDLVREYVEKDASVKGIWCVPKYSNPQGYTYSSETVEAFAALKPAADDFRIFWDNAYAVHGFRENDDYLENIFDACEKYGSADMVYEFASTSKITFPGAGVAVIAASENNVKFLLKQMGTQTIGYDKINMLRHVLYLRDMEGIKAHMAKQADIMRPKFDAVIEGLESNLGGLGIGEWTNPNGGYFVCFTGLKGTAKRCVQLCKDAGVTLTGAGAPFPFGIDPEDNVIRIAPSYPSLEQVKESIEVLCLCQKIAAIEVLR